MFRFTNAQAAIIERAPGPRYAVLRIKTDRDIASRALFPVTYYGVSNTFAE